jgi:mono/diheme cytochrome c family protein
MHKGTLVILAAMILMIGLPAMAASDGAALYKPCATCHGANGAGDTPVGKSLKVRDLRSPEVQKQTDLELTKIIAGGKGKMPAYGKKMSEADIQALIAHIRTLK